MLHYTKMYHPGKNGSLFALLKTLPVFTGIASQVLRIHLKGCSF